MNEINVENGWGGVNELKKNIMHMCMRQVIKNSAI